MMSSGNVTESANGMVKGRDAKLQRIFSPILMGAGDQITPLRNNPALSLSTSLPPRSEISVQC